MDAAADLHRIFVGELIDRLGDGAAHQRILLGTPRHAREAMLTLGGRAAADSPWDWADQRGGDLGARMRGWFSQSLHPGAAVELNSATDLPPTHRAVERSGIVLPKPMAVLIGADCPTLRRDDIAEAFAHLQTADVVLGPARDGGYYLIGLTAAAGDRRWHRLFENVPWSSPQTLQRTLTAAGQANLKVSLLPTRRDVDDVCDLQSLLTQLGQSDHPDDQRLAQRIVQRCQLR